MAQATTILLPSAARASTTATAPEQATGHARGLLLLFNLTVRGAAEIVTPSLQVKDPVSGTWVNYATWTATGGVAPYGWGLYPGSTGSNFETRPGPLPPLWRVNLVHSGSTAHTYSLVAWEVV